MFYNISVEKYLIEDLNFQKTMSPSKRTINSMGVSASGFKEKRRRDAKSDNEKSAFSDSYKQASEFFPQNTERIEFKESAKRPCFDKDETGKVNSSSMIYHNISRFLQDLDNFKIYQGNVNNSEKNKNEDISNYVSSKNDSSNKEINISNTQLQNMKSSIAANDRNELIIQNLIKKHLPKDVIEETHCESSYNHLDCNSNEEGIKYFDVLNKIKRNSTDNTSLAMPSINNPFIFVTENRKLCDYQDVNPYETRIQYSNETYGTRNPTTSITEFDHENFSRRQATEGDYLNPEGYLSQLVNYPEGRLF